MGGRGLKLNSVFFYGIQYDVFWVFGPKFVFAFYRESKKFEKNLTSERVKTFFVFFFQVQVYFSASKIIEFFRQKKQILIFFGGEVNF